MTRRSEHEGDVLGAYADDLAVAQGFDDVRRRFADRAARARRDALDAEDYGFDIPGFRVRPLAPGPEAAADAYDEPEDRRLGPFSRRLRETIARRRARLLRISSWLSGVRRAAETQRAPAAAHEERLDEARRRREVDLSSARSSVAEGVDPRSAFDDWDGDEILSVDDERSWPDHRSDGRRDDWRGHGGSDGDKPGDVGRTAQSRDLERPAVGREPTSAAATAFGVDLGGLALERVSFVDEELAATSPMARGADAFVDAAAPSIDDHPRRVKLTRKSSEDPAPKRPAATFGELSLDDDGTIRRRVRSADRDDELWETYATPISRPRWDDHEDETDLEEDWTPHRSDRIVWAVISAAALGAIALVFAGPLSTLRPFRSSQSRGRRRQSPWKLSTRSASAKRPPRPNQPCRPRASSLAATCRTTPCARYWRRRRTSA